jgi:riboflavin kinase/FMN adenylyltransferase
MSVRSVVSIGVFDGLHRGHRAILERALARARAGGQPCVVVSFDPHPDVVLARDAFRAPAPLTPPAEKRRRLLAMGMSALDVIPFTRELAALTPEAFIERHLLAPHGMTAMVVGEGFALGRARSGTVERLREIGQTAGFEVEAVPLLVQDGAPVSSTRVRTLLGDGKVAEAARLLGRPYDLTGLVVTGEGLGRQLGVPTANLRLHEEKLLPRDGIYAVRAGIEGEPVTRPAAMSLGVRPTFDGQVRTLEVHLLDWSGDLVGRDLTVELVDWLRPELRFDSPQALTEAMMRDLEETRRRLAQPVDLGA